MSTKMSHSIDKILLRVKSFTKRSGWRSGSDYKSLIDGGRRSCGHIKLPDDIPKGCLAVYVGTERFVIPTKYLSYQLFKELLKGSEEEFGYEYLGGLEIACEPAFFKHLLWFIRSNSPAAANAHLKERLDDFYAVGGLALCKSVSNEIHVIHP